MPDQFDLGRFQDAMENAAEIEYHDDGSVTFQYIDGSATTITRERYLELSAEAARGL